MQPIYSIYIDTIYGRKEICVYNADITRFDEPIDVLTTSAFYRSYAPSPRTVFEALYSNLGISVAELAQDPIIDLREIGNIWLSRRIDTSPRNRGMIDRIGCIEMKRSWNLNEYEKNNILTSLNQYFNMLNIAATANISLHTIAMPFLGAGNQRISSDLILLPMINECISYLKDSPCTERFLFIEYSEEKAKMIADALANSYTVNNYQAHIPCPAVSDPKTCFISYSYKDKYLADTICQKLELRGHKVWYAPRDIESDVYSRDIVLAIKRADVFIVILTPNSMRSQHVLNEISLAFNRRPDGLIMYPIRVDHIELDDAFSYYLSTLNYTEAALPLFEQQIDEFAEQFRLI